MQTVVAYEYVKPNQVRFILTKNDNFYHLNKYIFNNVQKKVKGI